MIWETNKVKLESTNIFHILAGNSGGLFLLRFLTPRPPPPATLSVTSYDVWMKAFSHAVMTVY